MAFAVTNRSSLDDSDVAAFAAAVDSQLRNDFCPAWPAAVYQPVQFIANPSQAGAGDTLITVASKANRGQGQGLVIVCNGDPDQASVDLSQLVLDTTADPTGAAWIPMPDGRSCALDPTDPVDGYFYTKTVGQRAVRVSNFVFPSWFDAATTAEVHDQMGLYRPTPWALRPGGFLTVRELNGSISGICGTANRLQRRADKLDQPSSRAGARGAKPSDTVVVRAGPGAILTASAAQGIIDAAHRRKVAAALAELQAPDPAPAAPPQRQPRRP